MRISENDFDSGVIEKVYPLYTCRPSGAKSVMVSGLFFLQGDDLLVIKNTSVTIRVLFALMIPENRFVAKKKRLHFSVGIRLKYIKRDLNQFMESVVVPFLDRTSGYGGQNGIFNIRKKRV